MKHILFPVDFSEQCSDVVPQVRALAIRFGSRVTLLTVIPPVWAAPPSGVAADLNRTELEFEFQSRLEATLVEELAGVPVQRAVRSGDPALQIVKFSQAVDVIVMPAGGIGMAGALLGSVTAKVLNYAPCPVWTAVHASKQPHGRSCSTMLCAVDGTPSSADLIRRAFDFAQAADASLSLLHILPPIPDWMALPDDRALKEAVHNEARAKVETLYQRLGVYVPLRVSIGEVAETVAKQARKQEIDLLIIGRGSGSCLGRLRTHAYGIIRNSPCPVLSF